MYSKIKIYFLLFLIYAFIGWCIEVSCKSLERKKFINRGFLLGPYCPIYGYGAMLITVLLNRYSNHPILLFFMAILICGVLEYSTSYFMEKIFRFRWWDYSRRKLNLNGRVCIGTIIPFGIMGMSIIYLSNPLFLNKLLYKLSLNTINIFFYLLGCIFITDNVLSFITIIGIRNTTTRVNIENIRDNTEEITKKVREILLGKSFMQRRLLNAYPKLEAIKLKVKEKIDETKDEIEKQKEIIDEKVNKAKKELEEKIKNIDRKNN